MNLRALVRSIYTLRFAESIFVRIATWLYSRNRPPLIGCDSSITLLFPTATGSVGDEAMAVATVKRIRETGSKQIGLISFSPSDDWTDFEHIDEVRDRPTGSPLKWFGFCRWLSRYDALGIIGADVLDGYYSPERSIARLQLAQVAHALGLRVVLLGFSYRADPEPSALEALKQLSPSVSVFCRDPVSLSRVKKLSGKSATQVADLAFLLVPNHETSRVRHVAAWIQERRAKAQFILGVNCNLQALGKANSSDRMKLIEAYAQAIAHTARKYPNISFVLIPHDSRGANSDEAMARDIYSAADVETRPRCYLVEQTWSAAEIKAVASHFDAAITGRMHFAIACLGSGTPVASFEYQDKFTGLYELFRLPELCTPGITSLDPSVIAELIATLYSNAPLFRNTIQARLPEIQRLSQRNVSALFGEKLDAQNA